MEKARRPNNFEEKISCLKKKTANKKLLAIVNFFRLSIIYFSSDNTPHKCIYIYEVKNTSIKVYLVFFQFFILYNL